MKKDGANLGSSVGGQARWRAAAELLERRQYEQVASLLRDAQLASEQAGDGILADILAAACRVCLACNQCRAQVEWHRRAREEADQRERELKAQLGAILDVVSGHEAPGTRERRELPPPAPVSELGLPDRTSPEPAEHPGLWQRIQAVLGRGSRPQVPAPQTPAPHPAEKAEVLAPSSAEETKPPSTPVDVIEGVPGPLAAERAKVPAAPPAQEAAPPAAPPDVREEVPGAPPPGKADVPEAEVLVAPSVEEAGPPSAPPDVKEEMPGAPSLVVYCLGPFRVYQDEQPVEDWPSTKGKSIFKYLVTHRERPVGKEVLMELFWPGAPPDAARNNLNVAIYGLRQALRQARPHFSHVLFRDDCYLLNPGLQIWIDCEALADHLTTARALEQRGELDAAMRQYGAAEALYQGEFLQEDRYEDWPIPLRQSLRDDYLSLLEQLSRYYLEQEDYAACATMCGKMLAVDACCEQAHRRLMRCYSRQGQPYLALRQYHLCVERLREELDVAPTLVTRGLHERIRRCDPA